MIKFENVTITYDGAAAPVLANATVSIPEGELVLVVGRTGSGKTTFLRAINGLVPHFTGGTLSGRVTINGMPAAKPATAVEMTAALAVEGAGERTWVSRGAHKLIGALEDFGIDPAGRRCLDAGASTGGFTEVLLDRGAVEVVARDGRGITLNEALHAN